MPYNLYTLKEIHKMYDLPRDYFTHIHKRLTDNYLYMIDKNTFDILWFNMSYTKPAYLIEKSTIFQYHTVFVDRIDIRKYD